MKVVVVESPAKAKTINKYLGDEYVVLASYGHVRDLFAKDGSVKTDQDFEMVWDIDPKSAKHIKAIADALKGSNGLILATDPDREGEAIAWHVLETLKNKKVLDDVEVNRVVFHEITKSAVTKAMGEPRELDRPLIDAYLARRALDYLVGFTLSPVLWRKLPGAKSAGRVQSVALRIICDREREIEAFVSQEYWTVDGMFRTGGGDPLTLRMTHLDGKKLTKFDLGNEAAANGAKAAIEARDFSVANVESKPTQRHPAPPFTTSTLQQEASRKLGFNARHTMSVAQKLYEGIDLGGETVGLITYMRTDSVNMAQQAMMACRDVVRARYSDRHVPEKPRFYKSKAKNAQEAHEAIRPTDPALLPDDIARRLNEDQRRLYDLIWKRAVASQMAAAQFNRTTIDISAADGLVTLRTTGSVLTFDGFLALYQEGKDDNGSDNGAGGGGSDDNDKRLPNVGKGEALSRTGISTDQHFTEPPPRFTEASLVKKLEELGIGRPSTYASTLSVLRDREYVHMDKNRFNPEDKGRLVTAFLEGFFERYVQYDFTAELEEKLDRISNGEIGWKTVMQEFWEGFNAAVADTADLRTTQVLDALNEILGPYVFHAEEPGADPRACPKCKDGQLSLKIGRYGAFVGCSRYPDCKLTRKLSVNGNDSGSDLDEPKVLGTDPETGMEVTVRGGRFGPYIQLGEPEDKKKPKRASIPKGEDPHEVTFERAQMLLSLPREVGEHPETGKKIMAAIGRYGPYVAHEGKYGRLDSIEEVFTVGVNRAVDVLASAKKGGRRGPQPIRELGTHPDDGEVINVFSGRYGPYVKHGKINATLPDSVPPEEVTLEQALELIAAKAAKGPKKKKVVKKKMAKKKATAKKKTKKSAAKKKATAKAKTDEPASE
jgi:DNA topoisomerase-1